MIENKGSSVNFRREYFLYSRLKLFFTWSTPHLRGWQAGRVLEAKGIEGKDEGLCAALGDAQILWASVRPAWLKGSATCSGPRLTRPL